MTNYILRPMNSHYIIQTGVVVSSVLLGMLLYPRISRMYRRFINDQYEKLSTRLPVAGEKEKTPAGSREIPSIIGKSKFTTGHSRTKAATSPVNEKVIEKEDTFVPEAPEDAGRMDQVSIPLEKEGNDDGKAREAEFDPQEEETVLETGQDAVLASGASYDQLMNTGRVIAKEEPSDKEKDRAGGILYENRSTGMVEKMISSGEKLKVSIASLIAFHLAERAKDLTGTEIAGYPDDFNDFDIDSIF